MLLTEGRELAKHFGCRFIETSAKQRINVDEAFSNLVREIRRYNKEQQIGRAGVGAAGGPASNNDATAGGKHGSKCCSSCVVL
jgi:GTPase KRas protein